MSSPKIGPNGRPEPEPAASKDKERATRAMEAVSDAGLRVPGAPLSPGKVKAGAPAKAADSRLISQTPKGSYGLALFFLGLGIGSGAVYAFTRLKDLPFLKDHETYLALGTAFAFGLGGATLGHAYASRKNMHAVLELQEEEIRQIRQFVEYYGEGGGIEGAIAAIEESLKQPQLDAAQRVQARDMLIRRRDDLHQAYRALIAAGKPNKEQAELLAGYDALKGGILVELVGKPDPQAPMRDETHRPPLERAGIPGINTSNENQLIAQSKPWFTAANVGLGLLLLTTFVVGGGYIYSSQLDLNELSMIKPYEDWLALGTALFVAGSAATLGYALAIKKSGGWQRLVDGQNFNRQRAGELGPAFWRLT